MNARRLASGNHDRLLAGAKIAVFDIGGPLALYAWLRSEGQSTVTSLVVSGILPAVGVALGIVRRHAVDVVAILVLLGIVVGTSSVWPAATPGWCSSKAPCRRPCSVRSASDRSGRRDH